MKREEVKKPAYLMTFLGIVLPIVISVLICVNLPATTTIYDIPDDEQCVITEKALVDNDSDSNVFSRRRSLVFESVDGKFSNKSDESLLYVSDSIFQKYDVGDELTGSDVKTIFELSGTKADEARNKAQNTNLMVGLVSGMLVMILTAPVGFLLDEMWTW